MWKKSIIKCLIPVSMWYQNIAILKKIKIENAEIDVISIISLSKEAFEDIDWSIIYNTIGSVIKKTYMPDNLWVIDEKADIGSLIFVKSRYTGRSCIVC